MNSKIFLNGFYTMLILNCCRRDSKLAEVNAAVSLHFIKLAIILLGNETKRSRWLLRKIRYTFDIFGLCFWEILNIFEMKCLNIAWVGCLNNILVKDCSWNIVWAYYISRFPSNLPIRATKIITKYYLILAFLNIKGKK